MGFITDRLFEFVAASVRCRNIRYTDVPENDNPLLLNYN